MHFDRNSSLPRKRGGSPPRRSQPKGCPGYQIKLGPSLGMRFLNREGILVPKQG